ncbi:hypothetical protein [Anaerovirgula multivorans]|nr:hypothetical protein [Anaerovirgula multivorans]
MFFYPNTEPSKSTRRRQLNSILDGLDDKELIIVGVTANRISQAREVEEG